MVHSKDLLCALCPFLVLQRFERQRFRSFQNFVIKSSNATKNFVYIITTNNILYSNRLFFLFSFSASVLCTSILFFILLLPMLLIQIWQFIVRKNKRSIAANFLAEKFISVNKKFFHTRQDPDLDPVWSLLRSRIRTEPDPQH